MNHSIKLRDLFQNRWYFTKRIKGLIALLKFVKNKDLVDSTSYPTYFEQQADLYADNIAIKYEDSLITYKELNEAANRVANYLANKGFGKGDTIALFMENRPEYLIYKLAITKLGGTAALINSSQKGNALVHSINLVKSSAVIVGEELIAPLQDVKEELCVQEPHYIVPDLDTLILAGGDFDCGVNIVKESLNSSSSNLAVAATLTGSDPAWYIYTSGTTGLPKASVQKHNRTMKALMSFGNLINPLSANDVVYSSLPLYHITALSACWFTAIHNGAALALSRKFSASKFWQDVDKHQATSFGYVGELCRYLLNQPESKFEKNNTIRTVTGNGLRPEIWDEFKSRFNIEEINEIYGASEGNLAAFNIFNLDKTVGMCLGSYELVKVDEETEEPIKDAKGRLIKTKKGEPGLLIGVIDDLTPFDGYTDPAKNESKIIRNAFKQGDAYFNTGDVLRNIGCKQLQFCDRTGDTYRWKGENVSTQEIENVSNKFPEVLESVAYGVEIPKTNGKAGMLSIKLNEHTNKLNGKGLYDFLQDQLPAYSVPIFVRIKDELEKTGTFKYLKAPLKKEGYNLNHVEDPIYVCLPGEKAYQPLTPEIATSIEFNNYRF